MTIKQTFKDAKDALIASEEIKNMRVEICRSCEYFRPGTSRCGICGCFVKAKATLSKSKCPKSKW